MGGGPVGESVVEFTGTDVYGKDAAEAVRLASSFLTW
jgi:methanogenic corrinoid protein MtbC1